MSDGDYGRVIRQETCSVAAVRRVAAMLDQDPDEWSEGDTLPRGWQFILLAADTRRSAIRSDGFPGLGVPLPELGLPRLLLGGRTVRYHADISVGVNLRRESKIQRLTKKDTPNGPMAILTIAHEIYMLGTIEPAIVETQTFLLLSDQPASKKDSSLSKAPSPAHRKTVVPDETLLFQYSALGFNSHKIHLDRAFAREKEGFPDLVVNGGLATLYLTEFVRNELGATLNAFTAKHMAPLFCNRPIHLGADREGDKWLLRAFDEGGHTALEIEAEAP
jgi:3-methylfumaryl-CoA hydratase